MGAFRLGRLAPLAILAAFAGRMPFRAQAQPYFPDRFLEQS